jgi:hypothetical protein
MEMDLGWVLIGLGVVILLASLLVGRGGRRVDRRSQSIHVEGDNPGIANVGDVGGNLQQGNTINPPPVSAKPEKKDWREGLALTLRVLAALVLLGGALVNVLGD